MSKQSDTALIAPAQQQWINTVALPYFDFADNNKDHQRLSLYTDTPSAGQIICEIRDDWGIESREQALDKLQSLLNGTHVGDMWNNAFASRSCSSLHDWKHKIEQAGSHQLAVELEFIDTVYSQTGYAGFLAWDLARGSYLARQCFYVNWLTEEETEYIVQCFAKAAQSSFFSWQQYTHSFAFGYQMACYINDEDDDDEKIDVLLTSGYRPGYYHLFNNISKINAQHCARLAWYMDLPTPQAPQSLQQGSED